METNFYPDTTHNDERLLRLRMRHKAAGYGVYFLLLEILQAQKGCMCQRDYNIIAFELHEDAALVKSVVEDFGLFAFTDDGKCFYSEDLLKRMEKIGHISKARREAAQKRWGNRDAKTQEEYFTQLRSSEVWLIDMTIKHKCTRDEIISRLDEFEADCKCRCYTHHSRQDAGRHFHEWLTVLEKARKRQPKAVQPIGVASLKVYDQWAEAMCMRYHMTHEQLCSRADEFALDMACGEKTLDNINNLRQYFNGWLRSRQQEQSNNATTEKIRQPIAAGRADRAANIAATMATLGAASGKAEKLPY
jgi:hypothetical protein